MPGDPRRHGSWRTGVILAGIIVVEATYWPRQGARVRAALDADDDATAAAILRRPLSVALSRTQFALAFVTVFLMVFRPG